MRTLYIVLLLLIVANFKLEAQAQKIELQKNPLFRALIVDESGTPLIGASVRWQGASSGIASDLEGWISLPRVDTIEGRLLEISYVGYDLIKVEILPEEDSLQLMLHPAASFNTVIVEGTEKGNFSSSLDPINVETIKSHELKRAACCSLAESFETNATVNVSAADAVTGSKEIEMLGLRGTYVQMQIEGRPALNRLDRPYGLEFIPGSWIESINISKGASTVRNGSQSIAGQINVELQKPTTAPRFYLNLYGNQFGRFEINNTYAFQLSPKWSMGLLGFAHFTNTNIDHNGDGFVDVPIKNQINILNRWLYSSPKWHIEFNLHGLRNQQESGQTLETYHHAFNSHPDSLYSLSNNLQRYEFFGKFGFLGMKQPQASAALVYSGTYFNQNMLIGKRNFDALQRSFYAQATYQNAIAHTDEHFMTLGATYTLDDFKEKFAALDLSRTEQLIGAYGEYEYTKKFDGQRSFGLIAGLRTDAFISSATGFNFYATPRLNMKYSFSDNTIVRASAGRGVRMPNGLSENLRYMASSREFVLPNGNIRPELAWNYGVNLTHNFQIGQKDGAINIDLYRTDFSNQLLADLDSDLSQVRIYNSTAASFANSFLVSYQQDIFKGFNARIAYKFNDVRSVFNDSLQLQPFSPRHRGLITAQYITAKKRWQFDATLQYTGTQRLPTLAYADATLPDYRQKAIAPAYFVVLAQITHYFPNGIEVYLGSENLGNYRQLMPIIDPQNPFGNKFDAASVYGPIMRQMAYLGIRYTPKAKKAKGHNDHEGHNHAEGEGHDDEQKIHFSEKEHVHTVTINTSAQCGMCKTTIETKLRKTKGVHSVSLNIETKALTIAHDHDTDIDALRKAVSALGYDADQVAGDAKAYEKLPACCKKE
jgi:outer membrane receptor for ferrienterochelin and colicin/copper chaperone CopZ